MFIYVFGAELGWGGGGGWGWVWCMWTPVKRPYPWILSRRMLGPMSWMYEMSTIGNHVIPEREAGMHGICNRIGRSQAQTSLLFDTCLWYVFSNYKQCRNWNNVCLYTYTWVILLKNHTQANVSMGYIQTVAFKMQNPELESNCLSIHCIPIKRSCIMLL